MAYSEHFFQDRESLSEALCQRLTVSISTAIKLRRKASLALPGGTSPIPIFKNLAKQTIDWSSVTLTLTDERWVANNHPDSNEGLLRQHLLNQIGTHFIPLKNASHTPETGQKEIERSLEQHCLPLDVCILGMGDDGHIASLFPNSSEINIATLAQSTQHCIAVNPPHVAQARLSLTLNTIMQARELVLLITGKPKQAVYQRALTLFTRKEHLSLPVSFILHQEKVPIHIYWAP